jgi:hypothetical protein
MTVTVTSAGLARVLEERAASAASMDWTKVPQNEQRIDVDHTGGGFL